MTVIVGTLVVLIYGLGLSYAVSFLYSARTLMYFILRKRVDNTEMSEVYLEEEEEDLFEDDVEFGDTPPKDEAGEGGEGAPEGPADGGEKKEGEPAPESPESGTEKKAEETSGSEGEKEGSEGEEAKP